jgi:hypothetical protein
MPAWCNARISGPVRLVHNVRTGRERVHDHAQCRIGVHHRRDSCRLCEREGSEREQQHRWVESRDRCARYVKTPTIPDRTVGTPSLSPLISVKATLLHNQRETDHEVHGFPPHTPTSFSSDPGGSPHAGCQRDAATHPPSHSTHTV